MAEIIPLNKMRGMRDENAKVVAAILLDPNAPKQPTVGDALNQAAEAADCIAGKMHELAHSLRAIAKQVGQ